MLRATGPSPICPIWKSIDNSSWWPSVNGLFIDPLIAAVGDANANDPSENKS